MKKYNNYIIKTTKTTIELTKYVQDYYQKQFKTLMTPFWRTIDNQPDAITGAKNIRDYILKCRDTSLDNEPQACFAGLMINFICSEILGAYSQAFSQAFQVAHLCGPVPELSYPFELKIWIDVEPVYFTAKKNITALDQSSGGLPGDDSQIEKIDNGDGSWTFRSLDVVEWFSFFEFIANNQDTKGNPLPVMIIEVINIQDVKTFYYSFANLDLLTHITFSDLSMTKDILSFSNAWDNCLSLTSFPQLDTSKGTNFYYAWADCSSLTSFPQLDVSQGTNFDNAWSGCTSLTSFPQLDVSQGTNFTGAWADCSSLPSCPGTDGTITIPSGATTTGMCFGI